ncbi:hypothetical protein JZ751_005234 [Albula glossodonta]|uniref:Solute carrier family 2, facilitated glucose transporter member 12 n=1 Tax=Albula glossodonta TaxID=121402 RepID=A0A8T2PDE2_9TELE|nr:hypothetical protein JZ751_005234 [Albula glossodonta]
MDSNGTEKQSTQNKPLKDHTTQNPLDTKKRGCGTFLLLASVVAAVSGFMLGYEMGLISGALLQLREILSLTCQRQEMVVSSLLLGALLISLVGGFILDHYGRKFSIILTACVVIVGTFIVICFVSYTALIIGRAIVGMAVALSGTASCLYIAEIAPNNKRGLLVCLYELMVVIGVLLGFGFSYTFATVPNGWKFMFAVVIPPAVLQAVTMLFLPVSPRFLMKKGNHQAAHTVLTRLRASSVDEELQCIQTALREESQHSFLDLFRKKDNIRMRLMIGVALVFFQQVTGQPNILFYASTILKSVGFQSNEAATLASTGLGMVKVAGTIPAILLVDRVGSKAFLCVGSVVMTMSLVALGVATLQSHTNVTSLCQSPDSLNQTVWLYNGSAVRGVGDFGVAPDFALGLQNSSHLTNDSRGWTTKRRLNAEGGESDVKVTDADKIGLPNVIFTYAALSFALLVFVILYIPETKGRSLEQISKDLAKKNHLEDRICYRVKPKTETLISMKRDEENGAK